MATATGFLMPTSVASDVLTGTAWSNAVAALANDDTEAIEAITAKSTPGTGSLTTGWIKLGDYGFDALIPSNAIILKVEIQVRSRMNSTSGIGNRDMTWARNGTRNTTLRTSTTEVTTLETVTYDVTSERAWTQADLTDAVFEVHWRGRNGNSATDPSYRLAFATVQVTWDLPPDPPLWEDMIDTFDRADGYVETGASTIWNGYGYDGGASSARVISNQLGLTAVAVTRLWTKAIFAGDFDMIVDKPVISSSSSCWMVFAIQAPGTSTYDCYAVEWTQGVGIAPYLRKYVDGVSSNVAVIYAAPCAVNVNDSLWVARRGTRITAYRKPSGGQWTKYLEAEAPDYISGPVGLLWSSATERWDNFRGGPLGPSITASDSVTLSDSVSWVQTYDIPLIVDDTVTLSDDLVLADFTPLAISGCKIWFDASQLALAPGAAVSPWPSLAPAGVAGTVLGTPAPVMRTPEQGINGLPVVRYTKGQGGHYGIGTGVDREFTVLIVARMWGATRSRLYSAKYNEPGAPNALIGWWGTYEDKLYVGAWVTPDPTTPASTNPKLYSADGTGTTIRLFRNGVLYSSAGTSINGWGNTFHISPDGAGLTEGSDCEVAEVVAYNRKLTDPERQQVEDYLRTKWLTAGAALTITPADSVTTSDSPSFVQDQTLTPTDTVTLSDIPTLAQDSVLNPVDSVTTSDSSTFVADLGLFTTEDVVLTDNVVWAQTFALLLDVSDSVTVTDFADLIFNFVSGFTDAVVLTDMLEVQVGLYFMSVVVLSDEVTWEQTTPQVVVTVI